MDRARDGQLTRVVVLRRAQWKAACETEVAVSEVGARSRVASSAKVKMKERFGPRLHLAQWPARS